MITGKNYSLDRVSEFNPKIGETIEECNITQKFPNTVITVIAGLIFNRCNLVNCSVPADAIIIDCNTAQIDRCGNLNENYICDVECKHMVSKEEIKLDGVVVDTIYEYKDEVL